MSQAITRDGAEERRSQSIALRNAKTGQFLTVTGKRYRTMAKSVTRGLGLSNDSVELMLSALSAATTKSRSAGTAMQFIVEVEPDGTPRIVPGSGEPDVTDEAARDYEMDAAEAAALEGALGAARERGRHLVAEILDQDEMVSADTLADHLHTTRATINSWRQAHQLLGLQRATRGYRYPLWQVGEDGRPFAALPRLFEILAGDSWEVYRFLVQPHAALDGLTGLEALRRKRDAAAIDAAEGIAEGTFA